MQDVMTYTNQISKKHEALLEVQYVHEDIPARPAQKVRNETSLTNTVTCVARFLE